MIDRRNASPILLVAALLLLAFFTTSFVGSEKNFEKKYIPFILQLSQSGTDKVTSILDSTKSVQMRSGFVTLQPGEDVGSHNTGDHEELLVILNGRGEIKAQGIGTKDVEKGMAVYIPPNNQHNVYCTGSAPFQYIYIVARVK